MNPSEHDFFSPSQGVSLASLYRKVMAEKCETGFGLDYRSEETLVYFW
jgi:hypothetical protein